MRRLLPLLLLLSLAALTASCADDDASDAAFGDGAAVSAPAEAPVSEEADEPTAPGTTTAETLERMRSMDPAVLARAHDHSDDTHAGHDTPRVHPNGVDPERLVIPAIDVDADVIRLGLEDDGSMEVPQDFAQTGWFDRGPKPGRVGPAVIAGHVDDRSGPAVFFRLSELEPGDRIEVHGEEGDIVTFAVREIQQHPKDAFPTQAVYSGTPGSELRLITCSGEFDRSERSYRDNTIVFAERVD